MKKRIVSVVIAMVLCLVAMIPAVAAEDINKVADHWAWKATVDGTDVTLSCVLADNSGKMSAGQVSLAYDTNKYTLGTFTKGDLEADGFTYTVNQETGKITVGIFNGERNVTADKEFTLFTVTFTMTEEDDTLEGLTRTAEVIGDMTDKKDAPETINNVVSDIEIEVITGTLGDFDGNDKVTKADAIYLLNYTLNPARYPIGDTFADFNHDGKVTKADAIYLLNYTLNPGRYPLSK